MKIRLVFLTSLMPEEALTASKSPLAGELLVSIMSSSVSKVDTTADNLPFDILNTDHFVPGKGNERGRNQFWKQLTEKNLLLITNK